MKKAALIIVLVIIGMVIFVKSGILDSLMLFLLAGVIPGTKYAIPSTFMLLLMMSVAWLLVFSLIPLESFRQTPVKAGKKGQTTKKRLPKQRYKQI